jgi:membrane protein DedA with SNARE-associated domain
MNGSDSVETLSRTSGYRPSDAPYVGAGLWFLGTLLAGYAGYEFVAHQLRYQTLWGVSLVLLLFAVVVLGRHVVRVRYH